METQGQYQQTEQAPGFSEPTSPSRPSPAPDTGSEFGSDRDSVAKGVPQYWRWPLLMLGLSLLALTVLARSTIVDMVTIWWTSATFTHGLLVFPMCAWLAWRERDRWRVLRPTPAWLALLPLMSLLALWVVSREVDVAVGEHFAFVGLLGTLGWLHLGHRVMLTLWFPAFFMLFAVPFGEGLIPLLMEFTADFTVGAVRLTGIPVFRDGTFFSMPRGDFEVAKACSGIRYVIASLALGTLYAYFSYRSAWRRAVFVLAALLVPIVANGIRAYGIVMIAHFSNMRAAVGIDHLIYGWLFFGVVIFLLFWVGSLFQEPDTAAIASAQVDDVAASATDGSTTGPGSSRVPRSLLPLVVVLPAIGLAAFVDGREAQFDAAQFSAPLLAAGQGGWTLQPATALDWSPTYGGASFLLRGRYEREGEAIELAVAVYHPGADDGDGEMVNATNRPLDADWRQTATTMIEPDAAGADRVPERVQQRRARAFSDDLLVWHWYVAGSAITADPLRIKIEQARQSLFASPGPSAVVLLAQVVGAGTDSVALERFVALHAEALAQCAIDTVNAPASMCQPVAR
jgi:exosortase A